MPSHTSHFLKAWQYSSDPPRRAQSGLPGVAMIVVEIREEIRHIACMLPFFESLNECVDVDLVCGSLPSCLRFFFRPVRSGSSSFTVSSSSNHSVIVFRAFCPMPRRVVPRGRAGRAQFLCGPLATRFIVVRDQNDGVASCCLLYWGNQGALAPPAFVVATNPYETGASLGIFLPLRHENDWCLKHFAQVIQNLPFALLVDPSAVTVRAPLKEPLSAPYGLPGKAVRQFHHR